VQAVQRESFADEFNKLKKNLPLSSSYEKLSPFFTNESFATRILTLVGVGGRLARGSRTQCQIPNINA